MRLCILQKQELGSAVFRPAWSTSNKITLTNSEHINVYICCSVIYVPHFSHSILYLCWKTDGSLHVSSVHKQHFYIITLQNSATKLHSCSSKQQKTDTNIGSKISAVIHDIVLQLPNYYPTTAMQRPTVWDTQPVWTFWRWKKSSACYESNDCSSVVKPIAQTLTHEKLQSVCTTLIYYKNKINTPKFLLPFNSEWQNILSVHCGATNFKRRTNHVKCDVLMVMNSMWLHVNWYRDT
jgi:hypothetical protein